MLTTPKEKKKNTSDVVGDRKIALEKCGIIRFEECFVSLPTCFAVCCWLYYKLQTQVSLRALHDHQAVSFRFDVFPFISRKKKKNLVKKGIFVFNNMKTI